MKSRRAATVLGRLVDVRVRPRALKRGEDGFILLESIVAISLITLIMGALATFTINTVQATNELRARQAAAQIATSMMALIDATPVSDLVTGRDGRSVDDQFDDKDKVAPAALAPWLKDMTRVKDTSAVFPAGATANIPTSPQPQVLNNINYQVQTYLGSCWVQSATSTDCVVGSTGIQHLRAVVSVTWTGSNCSVAICSYITATLVNLDEDPIFNTFGATPPVKPIVADPGDRTNTVGALVSLQLAVEDDTGVPPYTWQLSSGVLPTGLSMSASGLVTGTVTTPNSATPLTVRVTDALLNSALDSFTWTVVPAPTVTAPAAQTTPVGQAVNLTVAWSCPNAPCKFTLANAPAGLSINANTGVITGAPTTAGTSSNVTVTITDADKIAVASTAFTWTVTAGATIGAPGTRGVTELRTESVPIPYTCPGATAAAPCRITLTNPVPGVGLSTTANNITNNTTVTLDVTAPTGTVYLAGTVQLTAVTTGTSKLYNPLTVTITKGAVTASSAGNWTAYVPPTVGALGTRNATVGTAKDIPIGWTCAYAPCTLTLANTIPGLGLSATAGVTTTNNTASLVVAGTSGTVYVSGRVGATAVPSGSSKAYAVSLTITDADTAPATSTGAWTASNAPRLTNPGSQAVEPNQNVVVQMAVDCPNAGCTWTAEAQIVGDNNWTSIPITNTGRISYPSAPQGSYTIRVTVTDSDNIADQVTFPLKVQNFSLGTLTKTTARPSSGTLTPAPTYDLAAQVNPLADGYTYSMSGAPAWMTINTTTGLITGSVTSSTTKATYAVTVTVTSTASSSSTVSGTFRWTIS